MLASVSIPPIYYRDAHMSREFPNSATFPQFLVRCSGADGEYYVKEIGLTAESEDFTETLNKLRRDTAYFVPEDTRARKKHRRRSVKKIKELMKVCEKTDPTMWKGLHKRRRILSVKRHGEAVVRELETYLRESAHREWEEEDDDFYAGPESRPRVE